MMTLKQMQQTAQQYLMRYAGIKQELADYAAGQTGMPAKPLYACRTNTGRHCDPTALQAY